MKFKPSNMKKVMLLIIQTVLSCLAFSQNAFYDAQYLSTISVGDLNNILSKSDKNKSAFNQDSAEHFNISINLLDHEIDVLKNFIIFKKNPFNDSINNIDFLTLKSCIDKYSNNEYSSNKSLPLLGAAFPLITNILGGNFSLSADQQTKIIDGLTKYYAEEFRKAQLLTYLQTFENTIGKVGELQILFPQTYAKLHSSDPSRFPELGNEYKSIFNEDMESIVDNLINHIDNYNVSNPKTHLDSTLKWLTATNVTTIRTTKNYECFKISADIGSKLINNYHPVDLFNFIDNKYYKARYLTSDDTLSHKIILILHGLNLIQRNLLDTSIAKSSQFSNIWLNLQDINKLETKNEWLYFAGLLYQQDKAFFNTFIFDAMSKNLNTLSDDELLVFKTKIKSILAILIEIQNFRSNHKDENLKENFAEYMSLILKAVETTNYFTKTRLPEADFKKYLLIANYTLNIYDNVREKDYNNSIYYAVEILNQFIESNATNLQVANTIEQYGTFMTDVINSKNSDEVKDVIKKHAAPPTSFILKREYQRTFSITGQPGYFASFEKFDGKNQNFKFVSGITLPIGFEMTFKSKHGKENSSSWGVFAQLIDLGAVLNFRVGDSTSTLPDKIELKQIFSPGGSINYGFKNSPVSLGFGYQYSPQLRKITENGNEIFPNGHRIFLRLAWDIPLINIAKSKTK